MRLPRLFSDGMVLQQRLPIPVWGWSTPGQAIRVTLAGHGAETVANARGMWMVKLPSLAAEPYLGQALELVIQGDATAVVHDVAIGEVWLCSGQSNMEWPLACSADAGRHLAAADLPALRLFTVARAGATSPQDDVQEDACWSRSDATSAAGFSAVAWHFGAELHRALKVPVGLIHSSWAGTPAESWMSRAALSSDGVMRPILDRIPAGLPKGDSPAYRKQLAAWEAKARHQDPGNAGVRKKWHQAAFADGGWSMMELPQPWQRAGLASEGAVWFRRTVDLPADWKGKALELSLGPIDHFDTVYVNGERVGGIDPEIGDPRMVPRLYRIPAELVEGRSLCLAIRVFDRGGVGGFTGSADLLWLRPLAGTTGAAKRKTASKTTVRKSKADRLALAGAWRYRVELALEPKVDAPPPPLHTTHHHVPAALNNAMVQPLVPYALRGAIWYQGENNVERAEQYRMLLPALIRDWRLAWGQGDFPFGIVQLAGYGAQPADPDVSTWAELREAQALAAQGNRIGVVTAIDVGDQHDIHPRDKRTVGARLAAWALATVHEQTVPWNGPRFAALAIAGNEAHLTFTADGLCTRDGKPPRGFALAGRDRKYVWAEAKLAGSTVTLRHPQIATPVAVRYAWADNPDANLVDRHGLPALPFRTDDWPLSTAGKR
jgi:sialate O-acetylesterase